MKQKYLLLYYLAICQLPVFSQSAQQLRIDSLRKSLGTLHDTARVDYLNELATLHWSLPNVNRKDSLYHYAHLANQQAVKIGYEYGKAMSLIWLAEYEIFGTKNMATADEYINESILIGERIKNNSVLGRAYLMRSELGGKNRDGMSYFDCLKKSQDHFQKAGDKEGELEVTTWLCMEYANQGKYEEGFDYCDKCVQLSKQITPKHSNWHHELVQWSFLNMAGLYEAAGDYQTAMEYIEQCDQYAKANNLPWRMTIIKSKLFSLMGEYDSAMYYWEIWKKNYDSYASGHQAFGNNILANIYLQTGRYDDALELMQKGNVTMVKASSPRPYGPLLLTARIYLHKKDWRAALKFANEGFNLAKKQNIRPSIMEGHELLSEIYHQLGKDDKAYLNLRQYTVFKDSVNNRQFLWRLNSYKKAAEDQKKKASIELLNKDNDLKDQQLKQENLLKNFLIAGLISLIVIGFFIFRALNLKQKNEKLQRGRLENELIVQKLESARKHAELRQQATELEMQALRAQMSPHFIFNCLSSINRFILKHESEAASDYLTRFSRLIRLVLSNSKKPLVTLEDELEMVRLYIEMEKLRFKDSFDFSINFSSEIDPSAIFIPPLLLQPFAENAIWHGLMNKEGHGKLAVSFTSDEKILTCTITDNGVGRQKAEAFKSKKDVKGKSMGLQITTDRLAKLNMETDRDTFFQVQDLYGETGLAAGTKVILKIRLEHVIQEVLVDQNNYA
ncbi:MAG: histidine kinase [Cyclobacteriaceae bacterium]